MIYLDNAATTYPKPKRVYESFCRAAHLYGANPGRAGHKLSVRTGEAVYNARKNTAAFFGAASPECCVFTYNCTAAINMALKGILRKGDHVIISDLEHNAVVRPVNTLAKLGVSVSRAHVVEGDDSATLDNFAAQIRRNTRMILCTHASNVFGIVLPVEKIAALCKKRSIIFAIDAAQSAGVLELNFENTPADIICIPAHKGLYGMMGCGAMILREPMQFSPLIEGGTGSLSALPHMPDFLPDRFESGTANVAGICALSAGIDFVRERGISSIARHEHNLMRRLEMQLAAVKGVKIHRRASATSRYVPLLSISVEGMPCEEVAERLDEAGICVRAGFHCAYEAHSTQGTAASGTVRIAPSAFTTVEDIDTIAREIEKIAAGHFPTRYI